MKPKYLWNLYFYNIITKYNIYVAENYVWLDTLISGTKNSNNVYIGQSNIEIKPPIKNYESK